MKASSAYRPGTAVLMCSAGCPHRSEAVTIALDEDQDGLAVAWRIQARRPGGEATTVKGTVPFAAWLRRYGAPPPEGERVAPTYLAADVHAHLDRHVGEIVRGWADDLATLRSASSRRSARHRADPAPRPPGQAPPPPSAVALLGALSQQATPAGASPKGAEVPL